MADNHMWGNRFLMNMNMNMNMANMMSGNSTTDDASSQFSMTFSSWSIYKLQFLFLSWDIQTPWQFTLTWFAVAFAVVVWHFLGCAEHCLDKAIFTLLSKKSILSEQNISTGLMDQEPKKSKGDIELVCDSHETSHSIHDLKSDRVSTASHIYEHHNGRLYTSAHSIRPRARRPIGWHVVKTMHGLLTATKYILSLFLMLTAMTMIPSLMLALFVGYWVGDIIFADFLIDMDMDACAPLFEEGGVVGVLLRWALLAPIGSVFHHQLVKQVLPEESPLLRSSSEKTNTEAPTNWYKLILGTLPRVISLIVIILTLVWIVTVQGGFGYESFNAFGWHALTMIFFAAMFTNEALLTYRAPLLPQLANNRDYLRLVLF